MNRSRLQRRFLRTTVGFAFAPLLIGAPVVFLVVNRQVLRSTQDDFRSLARLCAHGVEQAIGKSIEKATALAARPEIVTLARAGPLGEPARIDPEWAASTLGIPSTEMDGPCVVVADTRGNVVARTPFAARHDPKAEPWWRQASADGKGAVFLGDLEDLEARIPILPLAVPVRRGVGNLVGVLGVCLEARELLRGLGSDRKDRAHDLAIAGSRGWRARGGETGASRPLAENLRAAMRGAPEGYATALSPEGVERLYAWASVTPPERGTLLPSAGGPLYAAVSMRLDVALRPIRTATVFGLAFLVCGLGGLVLAVSRLAHGIVRPVRTIHGWVERVRRGDLAGAPPIRTGDEIEQLAGSFGAMTEELRRSRAALEAHYRQLEQAVADRTAELEEACQKLRELDALKDNFLASISHELRTPLTAIRSYAELLLKYEEEDPVVRREFLGIVLRESERLHRLLNDLLDLAKFEAGAARFRFAAVLPGRAVGETVAAFAALATSKGVRLVERAAPGLPAVRADAERLAQVLANLASNAIKYTPPGGTVAIEATPRSEPDGSVQAVEFAVVDTGCGMDAEGQARLFEKFHQIQDARGSKPPGTGLGLAISREIVTRHGGRIWVESAPGKGSRFAFTIPLAGSERDEPAPSEGDPTSTPEAAALPV